MNTGKALRAHTARHAARSNPAALSASSGVRLHRLVAAMAINLVVFAAALKVHAQSPPAIGQGARAVKESSQAASEKSIATDKKEATGKQETNDTAALVEELRQMRQTIERLEKRVDQLETEKRAASSARLEPSGQPATATANAERIQPTVATEHRVKNTDTHESAAKPANTTTTNPDNSATQENPSAAEDRKVLDFFRDTTINLTLDGYYGYNFNKPVGRINLLRAYDVLSNSFSLNQAAVIIERAPNVAAGRRFGARLDLQYGQATETLQGNAANELRPQTYRPVFQAYGTYIFPIGSGLTVDFGKWASSLGIEANYAKDQMNYSRSYYFNFLPFYHFGFRAKYPVSDKLTVMYHLINGVQQSEDFNGFKSQHIALILTPTKKVSWQMNYYEGREGRSVTQVLNPGLPTLPTQPGFSDNVLRHAPGGRLHILDTYATWNATDKLTLALEGDYVISRTTKHAPPSRVTGGAAYARYQFTPRFALAGRGEYLSDRGGLFSSLTQALKETTLTADYKVAEGFLMRGEWRRDFSNQRFFLTQVPNYFKKEQNTATLGLIWWFGQKEGSW